jgi:hypothetical protein
MTTLTSSRRNQLWEILKEIDKENTGGLSKVQVVRAFSLNSNLKERLLRVPKLGEMTVPKLRLCIKEMEGANDQSIEIDEWIDYIEDLVDTSILVLAFDKIVPSGNKLCPIEPLIKEFHLQSGRETSSTELIDTLKKNVISVKK